MSSLRDLAGNWNGVAPYFRVPYLGLISLEIRSGNSTKSWRFWGMFNIHVQVSCLPIVLFNSFLCVFLSENKNFILGRFFKFFRPLRLWKIFVPCINLFGCICTFVSYLRLPLLGLSHMWMGNRIARPDQSHIFMHVNWINSRKYFSKVRCNLQLKILTEDTDLSFTV